MGFVITYLSLELAWHFTACGIKDKKIRPCMFKEIKTILVVAPQTIEVVDGKKRGVYSNKCLNWKKY